MDDDPSPRVTHTTEGFPLKDHGSFVHSFNISDAEIKEHRSADTVYVGLHVPRHRGRRHARHRHGHSRQSSSSKLNDQATEGISQPPSQHVQFLLGEEDQDEDHKTHSLFCEMGELFTSPDGDVEWKETARWIKFEEDVEEGGARWSKPHVATLSLHSLFELRSCLLNGTVILDMDAPELYQAIDMALDALAASNQLEELKKDDVRDLLLQRHRHLNERSKQSEHSSSKLPIIRSLADIGRKYSLPNQHGGIRGNSHDIPSISENEGTTSLTAKSSPNFRAYKDKMTSVKTTPNLQGMNRNQSSGALGADLTRNQSSIPDLHETASSHKLNLHFMKKIPPGSEAANILVGESDVLNHQIVCFIRLARATMMGDLTEVPVPTRFLFILLGPEGNRHKYHEIGRSIATLMSDEVFHDVAYHARHREDLLAGIDEFLDQVTVLPPGEWDPSIRIEPPKSVPSQESRKTGDCQPPLPNGKALVVEEEENHGDDPALQRTGRLFGGLVSDIKRKVPWYVSDFKDALHVQSLASFVFLYFACLTPIITFGGLLADATHNDMAAFESLLAGAIVGIVYALCSGQPLTILGSTGPVLVFETILYNFCESSGLNYLSFRFWIGLWTGAILLLIVMFDLSALVRYITRFTEESFAALIALIFIKEAIAKLIHIHDEAPVNRDAELSPFHDCYCSSPLDPLLNGTSDNSTYSVTTPASDREWHMLSRADCKTFGGHLSGDGCEHVADVFFLSILLFLGTFTLAMSLKASRNSSFFPTKIRTLISDFAVLIAIVSMVLTDYFIGLATPKLEVPEKFQPTNPERSWVVSPFGKNPWWICIVAVVPALLATILIFMDQQITAVIVNRKENKLVKGQGYHLDLFIVAILIMVNSVLGLPWFVAATVLSINHVQSLKKESECTAPGERPKFLGVREQRATGVAIFLVIGLSVFFTALLRVIPMPVLYGIFLYMGVSSLNGMQLVDRLSLMFMPAKYQPDFMYLRNVPIRRVHIFTVIQVFCLALLWVIKTIKSISIAFPIMVLAMCFIRKALDWVFTQNELKWLDDIMPEAKRKDIVDEIELLKKETEEETALLDPKCGVQQDLPTAKPSFVQVSVDMSDLDNTLNISEEMAKTSIWKSLQANESSTQLQYSGGSSERDGSSSSKRKHKKRNNKHRKEGYSDDKLPTIPSSPVQKNSNKKKMGPVSFYIEEEDDHKNSVHVPEIVVDPPSGNSTQ